ncbi:hypothetical protein [Paenibacillus hexagrammi]|uniref:Antirepressor AbbA n=1 Tax=Paenibacillus hexagrammi TaxID=2908839 RepID=A0ABY3SKP1_9BACL|nr:hypothetical protein [Paenibacillus sp. YPD9-1]UJF34619.1 hypothetical protein L0M14_05435 [Paenibacillus sp. YPD9-1]
MHMLLDHQIQDLLDHLHDEEDELLKRFDFTLEGRRLSKAESLQFIQFMKEQLNKKVGYN